MNIQQMVDHFKTEMAKLEENLPTTAKHEEAGICLTFSSGENIFHFLMTINNNHHGFGVYSSFLAETNDADDISQESWAHFGRDISPEHVLSTLQIALEDSEDELGALEFIACKPVMVFNEWNMETHIREEQPINVTTIEQGELFIA